MSSPKSRSGKKKQTQYIPIQPIKQKDPFLNTPQKQSVKLSSNKSSLSHKMTINTENFVICKVGSFDADYMVVGKIGQGSFGSVYKVYHKGLKSFRALKTIKKNPESKFSVFQEIQILKKLDHSNILKIYQFYQAKQSFFIVTDLFEGRQLFDQILDNEKISEQMAAQIIVQILRALNYIHLQGIAHRDIKAQNILLRKSQNGQYKVKIIDWGLGTLLDQTQQRNRVCGTPEYCAPEVLSGRYAISCDMWSLGVLSYVMLTGQMPFTGKNTKDTIEQVKKGTFNIKDRSFRRLSNQAQNFIAQLIQKDPTKRMTAEQAMNHTWVKQYSDKKNQSPPEHLKETLQRLRNFKVTNCFGVAVVSYVNNHLTSEEQKQKLVQIFKFLDKNGDGVLSAQQLIDGYSQIYGKAMATKIAEQTFAKLDINQNGSLQFSQFVAFGLIRHKQQEKLKLQQAFNLFDKDKNGSISMSEIKDILVGKFEDDTISLEQIKQIIQQIDQNGDHQIDFDEFVKCVDAIYDKVSIKKGKKEKSTSKTNKSAKKNG